MVNFTLEFHETANFTFGFDENDDSFKLEFKLFVPVVAEDVLRYLGPYQVTPDVVEQTLKTAQKLMDDDVKIEKIPYFEVSNNSGGITATIGKEV